MTDAVDSTIIFDLILVGSTRHQEARVTLERARKAGGVVLSEPVYAEVSNAFDLNAELDSFLRDMEIRLVRSSRAVLFRAGQAWNLYTSRRRVGLECSACGRLNRIDCDRCKQPLRSRQHLIADFIVGAHAISNADRLLTRDAGYYRTYFPDLTLA